MPDCIEINFYCVTVWKGYRSVNIFPWSAQTLHLRTERVDAMVRGVGVALDWLKPNEAAARLARDLVLDRLGLGAEEIERRIKEMELL